MQDYTAPAAAFFNDIAPYRPLVDATNIRGETMESGLSVSVGQ